MKAISERDDAGSGKEMPAAEESERFYLVLTGTLMYGFEWEDVVEELSRLLRLSREQAGSMLQGKRSCIRVALVRKKVDHLQGKVIACGAGCMIEPVNPPAAAAPESESAAISDDEMAAMACMELDLPETLEEMGEDPGDPAAAGDTSSLALEPVAATPSGVPETTDSLDEVIREIPLVQLNEENPPAAAAPARKQRVEAEAAAPPTNPPARRFGRPLQITGALLLLGVIGWGGLQLFSPREIPVAETTPVKAVAARSKPAPTPESRARKRMQQLGRLVRVWMIQYGGGFDPDQVTLLRMQQDLQLSAAELQDAWGTAMGYQSEQKGFIVTSAGSDREFGTEDDLQQVFEVE